MGPIENEKYGTSFFDCLVGYFYTSGFHALYKALEKTERNKGLPFKAD